MGGPIRDPLPLNLYIASSWRNKHAVEMLTDQLIERGHTVACFVRHSAQEEDVADFEAWVKTNPAWQCFIYDTESAASSDAVLYIGPSGTDAWAEVGIAYANKVPIIGLKAKGEPSGLMRHLVSTWVNRYQDLLVAVTAMSERKLRSKD